MLDVYPAREEPVGELAGVSGLDVARAAAERMGGRRVRWLPPRAERAARGARSAPPSAGDVLVTLGAGDVFTVSARPLAGGSDERAAGGRRARVPARPR